LRLDSSSIAARKAIKSRALRQNMKRAQNIGEQHWRNQINDEDQMNRLKIPHNAYVFVGDGRKALFLRNDGDEKFPNLKTEKVFEEENPSSHEQGTERPGHIGKGSQRSTVEPTDWHDIEEHRFARKVAAAMEQVIRAGKVKALVVVAPPRTLAELRNAFHPDVKACIIAEINKDLTKHPVGEIEKHLTSDAYSQ
jgi:protein required for attachment to host cells